MDNMQNQERKEPLNKNLALICLTIIIVCLIISGVFLYSKSVVLNTNNNSAINGVGNNNTPTQQPAQTAADISKVNIAGDPYIGNINAPVVIAFWSDYQCPFCKKAVQESMPQIITDYVNTGKAKIVFKDWAFLGADSNTLGEFARAVWAVAPDKFGAWHKAIFDNQGTENTGWATHDKIMSITTAAIGASDANKASQLAASNGGEYLKTMDADKTEGSSFGITGTPGTIIGKQLIVGAQPYDAFKSAIDQVLSGK